VLFSAETGSCDAIVSCCAEVMTLDSTRNSRFCTHCQHQATVRSLGEAYVLYVAKRSVDHRISEAVRHDDGISGMEIDWDAQKSVVSRRSNGVYRE
jgi:hypothetical protein